jgi:hypothetical protein
MQLLLLSTLVLRPRKMLTRPTQVRVNKYSEPTIQLVLDLLAKAAKENDKIDRILEEAIKNYGNEIVKELQ